MISLTHYVSGSDIAGELVGDTEELVECLKMLSKYLDTHPDRIATLHEVAVDEEACKELRALGTILSNFQGD